MKYNKEYIPVLFPFLENSLEDEWKLIKDKNSELSRVQRDKISEFCVALEEESHKCDEDCKHEKENNSLVSSKVGT